jgi:drug/metabolite transporter (DMT)-like permease
MDTTGITLAILSALFMGTIGVFSKITGLPAETVTFFRLLLGAGFLGLFLLCRSQGRDMLRWPTWPVIVNGGLLAGFIIFYVQAMNLTSMANAIMLVYLAPVAASAVAHFWLGERLGPAGWGLISLAMLGFAAMMEFRLDFSQGGNHLAGLGLATLAMCCYAGFILVNRRIRPEVPVMTRAFYQLLVGALVMLPFFLRSAPEINGTNALWLLGTGLIPGFLAITFAVAALSRLPAATFGTLAYFEPLAVVIFGWTIFGETLSPLQMTGCALIMASGCLKTVVARTPLPEHETRATARHT